MEEHRKRERLELTVTLQLEYINEQSENASKEIEVEVLDISSTGIGFRSNEKLDAEGFYNTKVAIWTKEVIPCVIRVVRETTEADGRYYYGGAFVGMSEIDQSKINNYHMIEELGRENTDSPAQENT